MLGLQPPSWYPTHVTKKVVQLFLFSFVVVFFLFLPPTPLILQRKMQVPCMSEHDVQTMKIECMQLSEQKSKLNSYVW